MSQCNSGRNKTQKTHYESRFNLLRLSFLGAFQLIKVSSISPLLCLREDDMTTHRHTMLTVILPLQFFILLENKLNKEIEQLYRDDLSLITRNYLVTK